MALAATVLSLWQRSHASSVHRAGAALRRGPALRLDAPAQESRVFIEARPPVRFSCARNGGIRRNQPRAPGHGARFWQVHSAPALDLFCAVPYGIFLYVVLGFAVYLLRRDFIAQQRFAWGFLVLNAAGFVTYHVYPVAPPWYFHAFGCAVDLNAAPSAGPNLLRVDAMLGIGYFRAFYGRASDVFGALPSLHVAYPLLMILVGWPLHKTLGRSLLVVFYVWMCFSATYLDHHWILDVVAGSAYALATAWLMTRIIKPPPIAVPVRDPLPGLGSSTSPPGPESPDRVRAFVRFAIRRGPLLWLAASSSPSRRLAAPSHFTCI